MRFILAVVAAALLGGAAAQAGEGRSGPEAVEFFETKVRPLLVARCLKCHSSEGKQRGGLTLDSKAGWEMGGDSGPALRPGRPEESRLIQAVLYQDRSLQMPPGGKLEEKEIETLVRWVRMGAPDPRAGPALARKPAESGKDHWAFRRPATPAVPAVQDRSWPRGDVDRFLLAAQETALVRPVGDADRAALLRRVTFDLTGLPPTPAELDAFLRDSTPEAFPAVVDRLLASRHFGEHWARHWFDVARFAESSGATNDLLLVDAWRYRDYVIAALNDDKPYDRFLVEQLAGDLLPGDDPGQRDRQVIATGFLALGPYDYDRPNAQVRLDLIDEQIDVTTRGLLGLTVACARCHDHKYDPIPTAEYYALAGIFSSTEVLKTGVYTRGKHTLVRVGLGHPLQGYQARPVEEFIRLQEDLYGGRGAVVRLWWEWNKLTAAHQRAGSDAERARLRAAADGLKKKIDDLARASKKAQERLKTFPPLPPMALAVRDGPRPHNHAVLIRGEPDNPGPVVPRGFLSALGPPSVKIDPRQSGRLELARWVAHRDNPLTARVLVNRVWMHLFGAGLVPTVDNFGLNGAPPSHPELLDYLAVRFMEDGWSVKKLLRALLLSRAYQLGVARSRAAEAVDADNRLLWRMNRRRLGSEAFRDAILAFSGQLDLEPRGRSLIAEIGVGAMRFRKEEVIYDSSKRSVYLPQPRHQRLEFHLLFDGADPQASVGQRDVTTVPLQALYLMNSPFILEQSRHAARRLLAEEGLDEDGRIGLAFRLALGRAPSARDLAVARDLLRAARETPGNGPETPPAKALTKAQKKALRKAAPPPRAPFPDDPPEVRAWSALCQVLLASPEFRYLP